MNDSTSTTLSEVDLACDAAGSADRSPCAVEVPGDLVFEGREDRTERLTQMVHCELPASETQALCRLWKGLAQRERWFPGQVIWSADDDWFAQELPPGNRTWTGTTQPDVSVLQWISQLAGWIDELHVAGVRLNGLNPNSLVIDELGKLVGLCLPPCLTERETPVELVPLVGLNFGLAAPELQRFTIDSAGPSADVFLLAALSFYLLTGAGLRDLMRVEFTLLRAEDPVAPATRAALERALDLSPARRPQTATAFAEELREALWLDRGASGFWWDAVGRSEIGLGGRTSNQDAFCLQWESGQDSQGPWLRGLAAVADGMGGGERGEKASGLCIDRIRGVWPAWIPKWREAGGALETGTRLGGEWLTGLNQDALRLGDELGTGGNFGSTLSALVFLGRQAILLHVGDSRVFRYRRGELTRLTELHTGAELLARGEITAESADAEELRHMLYSFVGSRRFEPQVECLSLESGDVFLLCSDGPLEGLSEADIRESLNDRTAAGAANELFRRCHASLKSESELSETPGSPRSVESDNLTILVVRVTDALPPKEAASESVGDTAASEDFTNPLAAQDSPMRSAVELANGSTDFSEDEFASYLYL